MLSKKLVTLITVLALASMMVAACGPGGGGGGGATGNTLSVTLTTKEFVYEPATITAKAGQTVNVTLHNVGTVKHTFVLKEPNVKITADIGKDATGTFIAPAAGTYTFFCDEPGHQDAGMKGTLTVQ
jgi:plastocyanin